MKKPQLYESVIKRLILQELWWRARKWSFFWPQPTLGIPMPDKQTGTCRLRTAPVRGVSDIIGCYKGRIVAIEVKRPGETCSDQQVNFQQMIRDAGGLAYVLTDAGQVEGMLKEIEEKITEGGIK